MHTNVQRYKSCMWGASNAKMRGVVRGLWVDSDSGTWSMVGCNSPIGGPKIKHEWETWPWKARNGET